MATPIKNTFKRGYSSIYYLEIEGIPYLFTEKNPKRVDSESTPTAMSGRTTVEGLIIDDSATISMEIDRKTGVGRGKGVSFGLSYRDLTAAGVLDDIFARPTVTTTSDYDAPTTLTTIRAATAGFPASGGFYWGREYITYTAIVAAEFQNCTRGVVGYKYKHETSSVSQSRYITNKPLIWRGRFVTLYEAIVDPRGRMVDSAYGTGDYTREIWKGYIDRPPVPGAIAMQLECLPLCRLLGNEIGFSVKWEDDRLQNPFTPDILAATPFPPFYDDGSGFVTVTVTFSGSTSGSATSPVTVNVAQTDTSWTAKNYFTSPELWCKLMGSAIENAVQNAGLPEFVFSGTGPLDPMVKSGRRVFFSAGSANLSQIDLTISPASAPYFLEPKGKTTSGSNWSGIYVEMEFKERMDAPEDFPYLIVQKLTGEGAQDFDVISPGIGVLTLGDVSEVVKWDSSITANAATNSIAIRLSERGVGASPRINVVEEGWVLNAAVGATGTVNENILTILESSGTTGERGTYDTLGLGFGLGVPEGWINTDALDETEFANHDADIIKNERATVSSLIGGWLAAGGNCLLDYRNGSTNTIELKPVQTSVAKFSGLENNVATITTADVMLGRLEMAQVVEPPNPVTIDTGCMLNVGAKVTVRDSVAVQEAGAHPMELKCPGMSAEVARIAALNFIYLGAGQYAITIPVAPWVDVQAGDKIVLNLSHPGIYDWANGTTAPATVAGRVMGWSRDLVTYQQTITVLLNGPGGDQNLLCPVALVASKSSNTVTLTSGVEWFVAGDFAILYDRGEEALGTPQIQTLEIQSISGNDVTFTTTPAAWVGNGTRMTYPNTADGSTAQLEFFFKVEPYRWSG